MGSQAGWIEELSFVLKLCLCSNGFRVNAHLVWGDLLAKRLHMHGKANLSPSQRPWICIHLELPLPEF